MLKKALTYKGAVMTWETDSNRHMNVMYYVNKFEHAGRNFNLELKIIDRKKSPNVGIVVLEQTLNYYQEVFEDDLIYVESTLLEIGNKAYKMIHEMYNGHTKKLVSTMKITLTLFDQIERKAIPFPLERKRELLEELLDKKT